MSVLFPLFMDIINNILGKVYAWSIKKEVRRVFGRRIAKNVEIKFNKGVLDIYYLSLSLTDKEKKKISKFVHNLVKEMPRLFKP